MAGREFHWADLDVVADPNVPEGEVHALDLVAGTRQVLARGVVTHAPEHPNLPSIPELLERTEQLVAEGYSLERATVAAQREAAHAAEAERLQQFMDNLLEQWKAQRRAKETVAERFVQAFVTDVWSSVQQLMDEVDWLGISRGLYRLAPPRCDAHDTELLNPEDDGSTLTPPSHAGVCPRCVLEPLTTAERAAMALENR